MDNPIHTSAQRFIDDNELRICHSIIRQISHDGHINMAQIIRDVGGTYRGDYYAELRDYISTVLCASKFLTPYQPRAKDGGAIMMTNGGKAHRSKAHAYLARGGSVKMAR